MSRDARCFGGHICEFEVSFSMGTRVYVSSLRFVTYRELQRARARSARLSGTRSIVHSSLLETLRLLYTSQTPSFGIARIAYLSLDVARAVLVRESFVFRSRRAAALQGLRTPAPNTRCRLTSSTRNYGYTFPVADSDLCVCVWRFQKMKRRATQALHETPELSALSREPKYTQSHPLSKPTRPNSHSITVSWTLVKDRITLEPKPNRFLSTSLSLVRSSSLQCGLSVPTYLFHTRLQFVQNALQTDEDSYPNSDIASFRCGGRRAANPRSKASAPTRDSR